MRYTLTFHDLQDKHGLTEREYRLMAEISMFTKSNGSMYKSKSRLAKEYRVTKRTILFMVEKLIQKKLVTKSKNGRELIACKSWAEDVEKLKNGAEITPVQKLHRNGAETTPQTVQKVHQNGAEITPPSKNREEEEKKEEEKEEVFEISNSLAEQTTDNYKELYLDKKTTYEQTIRFYLKSNFDIMVSDSNIKHLTAFKGKVYGLVSQTKKSKGAINTRPNRSDFLKFSIPLIKHSSEWTRMRPDQWRNKFDEMVNMARAAKSKPSRKSDNPMDYLKGWNDLTAQTNAKRRSEAK